MKTLTLTSLAILGFTMVGAKVTNVTPKFEGNSLPQGTVHFSGSAKPQALTPLAELLEIGSGTLYFDGSISFEAEEKDLQKAAQDGSAFVTVQKSRTSFPFEKGRYKLDEDLNMTSKTRIFAATDGSVVIQRGHSVTIVPSGKIETVRAWLPDQPTQTQTKE